VAAKYVSTVEGGCDDIFLPCARTYPRVQSANAGSRLVSIEVGFKLATTGIR
jgi:hypothetical protein